MESCDQPLHSPQSPLHNSNEPHPRPPQQRPPAVLRRPEGAPHHVPRAHRHRLVLRLDLRRTRAAATRRPKKIPVLVVDEDRSPLVAKIVEGLEKDSMADPKLASARRGDPGGEGRQDGGGHRVPQGLRQGRAPGDVQRQRPRPSSCATTRRRTWRCRPLQGSIMQVAMQRRQRAGVLPDRRLHRTDRPDRRVRSDLPPCRRRSLHTLVRHLQGRSSPTHRAPAPAAEGRRQPFTLKTVAQTAAEKGGEEGEQPRPHLRGHGDAGRAVLRHQRGDGAACATAAWGSGGGCGPRRRRSGELLAGQGALQRPRRRAGAPRGRARVRDGWRSASACPGAGSASRRWSPPPAS